MVPTALSLVLLSTPAHAGKCDAIIKRADTVAPEALPQVFGAAIACDHKEAEGSFPRFMTRATDSDILVQLSLVAIDADVWNPVWTMPGKISDYNMRDVIAGDVGAACTSHPKVIQFLEGAYFGLRGLDFKQWSNAFSSCDSPDIDGWLQAQLETPPKGAYDEKFDMLMGLYVRRKGPQSIEVLKKTAIAAADGGPYDSVLMQMDEAVAPKLGAEITDENRAVLEAALVEIAENVKPQQAKAVAERLVAAGADASAAHLLPSVFPDRQQDGGFVWGGVSIERGDCKGVKTAIVHAAEIYEPGKRWVVTPDQVTQLRALKPSLKKCTVEDGDWPVIVSPEPLKAGALDAWARQVGSDYAGQGYQVEVKSEKGITLD